MIARGLALALCFGLGGAGCLYETEQLRLTPQDLAALQRRLVDVPPQAWRTVGGRKVRVLIDQPTSGMPTYRGEVIEGGRIWRFGPLPSPVEARDGVAPAADTPEILDAIAVKAARTQPRGPLRLDLEDVVRQRARDGEVAMFPACDEEERCLTAAQMFRRGRNDGDDLVVPQRHLHTDRLLALVFSLGLVTLGGTIGGVIAFFETHPLTFSIPLDFRFK